MKREPSLFARTPRAGRHNHVDILPPGVPLPADLDRLVRARVPARMPALMP